MSVDRAAATELLAAFDRSVRADDSESSDQAVAELLASIGWDGSDANPADAISAFENTLGDMLDADVEITAGKNSLTLDVDGEKTDLSVNDLADLLDMLAGTKPIPDDAKRDAAFEAKHPRVPGGEKAGGQFIGLGGATVGGAKKMAKLAGRARGRSNGRAVSRGVGNAISSGTGKRARVTADGDGWFKVGSGKNKKRASSKKIAKTLFVAFAVANVLSVLPLLPLLLL